VSTLRRDRGRRSIRYTMSRRRGMSRQLDLCSCSPDGGSCILRASDGDDSQESLGLSYRLIPLLRDGDGGTHKYHASGADGNPKCGHPCIQFQQGLTRSLRGDACTGKFRAADVIDMSLPHHVRFRCLSTRDNSKS